MDLSKIRLGWELECILGNFSIVAPSIMDEIQIDYDASVNGEGKEIKLKKPQTIHNGINILNNILHNSKILTDISCGFHVHLSYQNNINKYTSIFKNHLSNNILALGILLENKIFDLVPESRRTNRYCKTITKCFVKSGGTAKQKLGKVHYDKQSNPSRYCWLNLIELYRSNGFGTVEIRLLGNTVRPSYIEAWIWLCVYLFGIAITATNPIQILDAVNDFNRFLYSRIIDVKDNKVLTPEYISNFVISNLKAL